MSQLWEHDLYCPFLLNLWISFALTNGRYNPHERTDKWMDDWTLHPALELVGVYCVNVFSLPIDRWIDPIEHDKWLFKLRLLCFD